MKPVNKIKFQLINILTIIGIILTVDCYSENGVTEKENGWKPITMPKNSTLLIARNPEAYATMNTEFTWVLNWTADRLVMPGEQIELRSLNLRTFFYWHYTRFEIDNAEITMQRPFEITPDYVFSVKGRYTLLRATFRNGLKIGETISITITARPPIFSDLDDVVTLYFADIKSPADGSKAEPVFIKNKQASAILHVSSGPVERLGIYAHPYPDRAGKVRIVVVPEDRFSNEGHFQKDLKIVFSWNNITWTEVLKSKRIFELDVPDSIGRLKAEIQLKDLSLNENIANSVRENEILVVTGNPVWSTLQNNRTAGFGEFHWHTEISSDGANSIASGLQIARDQYNLNYSTPSDHKPNPDAWNYSTDIIEGFNKDDEFVTFFGWENGTKEGHENYYFTDPKHPLKPYGDLNVEGKKLYELQNQLSELQTNDKRKFLAIPHHTNAVSETRHPDYTPYWFSYKFNKPDEYHRLIEILQTRGNMERNDYSDAWRGWYTEHSSVQDALAIGYKLGFTAGTDCHEGRPVRCNDAVEAFGRLPLHSQSVTGVWYEKMNRLSIFEGLYSRHTWACWDTRAIVLYELNGALMGSEISVNKNTPLKAHIKISADDIFQSIEVVSNAKSIWSGMYNDMDINKEIDLGPAIEDGYFYVRALLRNGGIIYGSPVFVTVK